LQAAAAATAAWLRQQGLDPAATELFNPLPLAHVSGLMPLVRAQAWGVPLRGLDPALMRDPPQLLEQAQPSPGRQPLLSLVPTQLQRLVEQPEGVDWLQRFAVIWVGGAVLPEALADRCRRAGLRLAPCYGSTETAAMVAALPPQRFLAGEAGCGQALPHAQLRLQPGSDALEITATSLALGTLAAGRLQPLPQQGGWWCSGDRAALGPAGLTVLGRLDGAIQSGGETVFPEQVEQRLLALAAAAQLPLAELLLLPQPDALWGERLVALVRPHSGAAPEPLMAALSALAAQLPPSQRPLRWCHCPDLERTAAGKWQRQRWRAWLQLYRG
ncbi:MAG: o-succinylbenzoate--CoA ligase, partial [Synechococcaceae bacterium WBB_10_009]|nr:o-succinylbenzoate--CoA ligase [Synechococcaceae bacterium WBB_10_009]